MKALKISRKVNITNAVWAADEWTLTTAAAHFLLPGDVVTFIDPYNPQHYTITLGAGTTGSTIVFASTDSKMVFPSFIGTDIFRSGMTGAQDQFTFGFGQPPSAIIQADVTGTNGAVVVVEASVNGRSWQAVATITLTAGTHDFVSITAAWLYGRLNITSIGANTVFKAVLSS